MLLLLTEGQMSDHKGVCLLFDAPPPARELIPVRGSDSNRFRADLAVTGITPCIP